MSEFVQKIGDMSPGDAYRLVCMANDDKYVIGPLTYDELNAIRARMWFGAYSLEGLQCPNGGLHWDWLDHEKSIRFDSSSLSDKLGDPELPTPQPVTRRIGRFEFIRGSDGSLMINHGANPTISNDEVAELEQFLRDTREAGK